MTKNLKSLLRLLLFTFLSILPSAAHFPAGSIVQRSSDLAASEPVDVRARDDERETALHDAAESGDLRSVQRLLDMGAQLGARGLSGETPLHEAVEAGHLNVVLLLIERGAPLNSSDHRGYTPLHMAVEEGHDEIALALISAGAGLGYLTDDLQSALDLARAKGSQTLIDALSTR